MADPFHAFDIRGVYGKDLTDELAYNIGRAIVKKFTLKKLVVGFDHRISSPAIFEQFSKGVTEMGCDVVSIGITSTSILYYECVKEQFDIGVMITASHNPKEYNGFKICTKDSQLITKDKGLSEIETLARAKEFTSAETKGTITEKDVLPEYVEYILALKKPLRKTYKIVVDCGNGVAGPIVEAITKHYDNVEIVPLFFERDGTYPNHEANPLKMENLEDLSKKIVEVKADYGFAFDGDADRCMLMDNNGHVVNTDLLLCVIADIELKEHPGETIYYDLRFSKIVKEHIESLGGKPVMSKVGNAVYKEKMIYEGGLLAAELSAHVMYRDNHALDDGFYLMAKVINYIDEIGKPVDIMVEPYKKYVQSPEINNKVKNADDVLNAIKEKFSDAEISELDGVTVSYENYWFNVRKSNTEPVVRMRVEADTKELLDEKVAEMQAFIDTFK